MPIWNIENTVDFINDQKKLANKIIIEENDENIIDGDEVELEVEKTLNSSTLKQFTMYINYKNKTNNIVCVSTNDAKFYYDEKQIESPYKTSIPIVKLQPDQEIAFSAITNLGCEQDNVMYGAACIAGHKEINENEFDFCIESRGQLTEKRIFQVALINIERKIKNFLKLLLDEQSEQIVKDEHEKLQGIIIVNNEDHTLGNLISRGMQLHNKISFAGYNLPHPLSNKVHFHYKLEKGGNIKEILKDVVEYYLEIYGELKKLIDSTK